VYLIAGMLALVPDPVDGPVGFHLVLGSLTPVLLLGFTRREFGSSRAAWLVAAGYALYPVAIRNSISVRSETPFVLLLVLGMLLLAMARGDKGKSLHAAAAGVAVTLAAMLRYEAWVLIPVLALTLWGNPRRMVLFAGIALLHPVFWMIGNLAEFGDPFYSITQAATWELDAMGKGSEPFRLHARQAMEYPGLILRGMSLVVGLGALAGGIIALAKRHRSRIWLVPLGALLGFLLLGIARGTLVPKLNYTEIPGTLLWPFGAIALQSALIDRWNRGGFALAALGGLGAMALLSGLVVSQGRGSYRAGQLTVSPLPEMENQAAALSLPPLILRARADLREGLICDFFGWGPTPHVALLTRIHPDQIFRAPGAPNRDLPLPLFQAFLDQYPTGVIVLRRGSRFDRVVRPGSGGPANVTLILEPRDSVAWPDGSLIEVMRYRKSVVSGQ
jgi:hypothetical protein